MTKIHAVECGKVRVRPSQLQRKIGGPLRILLDQEWSEWLPILAWVIEHPEGIIVVDTGETSRTSEAGYFPSWHPFFNLANQFDVKPEDEIGAQLRRVGVTPKDVTKVILTHLHTDHAGGLDFFSKSNILVSDAEYRLARSRWGVLNGCLSHRWPAWFAPTPISFHETPYFSFPRSFPVTTKGDVIVVPTPGHSTGHVSVVVKGECDYFLAGDATFSEAQLLERRSDGVSTNPGITVKTVDRICEYVESVPTVYLPTHDPASISRLSDARVTKGAGSPQLATQQA